MSNSIVSLSPLSQLKIPTGFGTRSSTRRFSVISSRLDDNSRSGQPNPQLNLSVLRFTLGIPGLDESYLPRWIGYGFGSLLVLNHFVGSNSVTDITSAQLRTEALGLSLAAFSIVLPYLGKFLKGATPMDQTTIPEGSEQIFMLSENVSNTEKEDLAWATYILLRNTNTMAVLISIQGELCVRGYWNTPTDVSKTDLLDWFGRQIEQFGISDVKDTLYFPQISDSGLWDILPKGTRSVLVQPVPQVPDSSDKTMETNQGFILVASTISYAYNVKDRAWIGALAKKFAECRFVYKLNGSLSVNERRS
ncbi:protein COFACTOR ASSEMBLY OF COMPLEX C SUBUNIT B CCB2, chloroplastic isoform X1 [Morus notabilis]|uniref:protein COFACTOR ASSEMBLY OF COMPLEX C SUBUNIT B CCB2, chloroplastic isoform X1 n=1 Tax=Morus notabilis TaxID=981085 RepID=UPI000CED458D|nr:protein COFACTOR ASSEMBLY OF COMPLEX C SUBUNIT B CCB2, chloroplastic isoform X1 [Morus notabilis]